MPLAHSAVTIIKVNGDYQSVKFKNTIEELDCYDKEIERLLHEVFTHYGLVECGWSASSIGGCDIGHCRCFGLCSSGGVCGAWC